MVAGAPEASRMARNRGRAVRSATDRISSLFSCRDDEDPVLLWLREIRCVLRTDLDGLLHPHAPPDLSLKRPTGVLAGAGRPESVYTWMRGANTKELLTGLGTRSIALTHEASDALPASRSVEYLREMLIHHGMLPDRDRQLAAFERWLATRIHDLAETPLVPPSGGSR
jgi:hypothetical protein